MYLLQLKIPPPVIGLLTGALMWSCHTALPDWSVANGLLRSAAVVLISIGLLIELLSAFRFFKAKTTVNPLKPERSQALVTNGLYRYSRNPMYVGMLSVLFGYGLWLGHPVAFVLPIIFVGYITTFQIKPEERALEEIFGEEYISYRQRVRRWV